MEYDLQKMDQDGINWAKQHLLYQRILNNDSKDVIAYNTPFEIYISRTCNAFSPTKNDRNRRSRQALKLRKQAKKATSRRDKRMQRTQLRLNLPSV